MLTSSTWRICLGLSAELNIHSYGYLKYYMSKTKPTICSKSLFLLFCCPWTWQSAQSLKPWLLYLLHSISSPIADQKKFGHSLNYQVFLLNTFQISSPLPDFKSLTLLSLNCSPSPQPHIFQCIHTKKNFLNSRKTSSCLRFQLYPNTPLLTIFYTPKGFLVAWTHQDITYLTPLYMLLPLPTTYNVPLYLILSPPLPQHCKLLLVLQSTDSSDISSSRRHFLIPS